MSNDAAKKVIPPLPGPTEESVPVRDLRDPDEVTINAQGRLDKLSSMLMFLKENQGSDLHISSGSRAMIRIRGALRAINLSVTDQEVQALIAPYMNEKQRATLAVENTLDFSFRRSGIGVFRINVFRQRLGLAFVLRYLSETPPTLASLDLPSTIKRSCYTDNGLIIVTGPTGSGKSTTLAAMVDEINSNRQGHIITLEDPIEYLHVSKKCMVNQRGMGDHFTDFSSALRSALREDPDVILVGEMRDLETMRAAIRAAETGHLVFSTLHTGSAAKTIDRILNSFPPEEQNEIRSVLAETLRVVVSQKLVPNKAKTKLRLFQDILVNTRAVANLIREGRTFLIENTMQTGLEEGMMLMDDAIRKAAEEGSIRMSDAHEIANDKRIIEESEHFLRDEFGVLETVDRLNREEFAPEGDAQQQTQNKTLPLPNKDRLERVGVKKFNEVIGIQHIVAELKPGFSKSKEKHDKNKTDRNISIKIKKIKDD